MKKSPSTTWRLLLNALERAIVIDINCQHAHPARATRCSAFLSYATAWGAGMIDNSPRIWFSHHTMSTTSRRAFSENPSRRPTRLRRTRPRGEVSGIRPTRSVAQHLCNCCSALALLISGAASASARLLLHVHKRIPPSNRVLGGLRSSCAVRASHALFALPPALARNPRRRKRRC
jgi:hypothetical protein